MRNLIIFGGISLAALSLAAIFAGLAADANAALEDTQRHSYVCDGANVVVVDDRTAARTWAFEHCNGNFQAVAGDF
jgi:hypothetical protein